MGHLRRTIWIRPVNISSARNDIGVDACSPDPERLAAILTRLEDDVARRGFVCYDPSDVLSHPLFLFFSRGLRMYIGRPLRLWEWYMPRFWRRLLGIDPSVVPTALYHVGMAHLHAEALAPRLFKSRADRICEQALGLSLDGEHRAWAHPYAVHAAGWRLPSLRRPGVPPSCAHHTARLGLLLLRTGLAHGRADLVDAARSAADALLAYHRWHHHDDGTSTVSYYPDSDDEVVNTGAEVSTLLGGLPSDLRTDRHRESARRLLRMVVAEQREDGLWDYVTDRHGRSHGPSGGPDNHHNAMILGALARAIGAAALDDAEQTAVRDAVARGMRSYLGAFFDETGACRLHPGGRRAGILDYAEGIVAMHAASRPLHRSEPDLTERIRALLPAVLEKMIGRFYNERTGDVSTYRRFGKSYGVGSIRCGAGPLMEALAAHLRQPAPEPWRRTDKQPITDPGQASHG